jgi:hypothetical protein
MRLFSRLLPKPKADDVLGDRDWQLPAWLIEACGSVLTLLIADLWLFCLAGRPQCQGGGCSSYHAVLAWSLLGLGLTLIVLAFMGLVPSAIEAWQMRQVRRARRAVESHPDFERHPDFA